MGATVKQEAPVEAIPLYRQVEVYTAITREIIEGGGELTPELEERLETIEAALPEKVERIGHVRRNLLALASSAREEEKRLAELRRSREAAADRLKDYVTRCLVQAGLTELDTDTLRLTVGESTSVEVDPKLDPAGLPERFRREKHSVSPDKKALGDAAKNGEELPEGVRIVRTPFLRGY